jgi:hypothetical protein
MRKRVATEQSYVRQIDADAISVHPFLCSRLIEFEYEICLISISLVSWTSASSVEPCLGGKQGFPACGTTGHSHPEMSWPNRRNCSGQNTPDK